MTTASRTGPSPEVLRDQLEPVRTALLDHARTRAARHVEEASAAAAAIIAEASAAADREVHRTQERARAAARARAEQRLEQVRADAHLRTLRTRAAIVRRLVEATHRAVLDLRDDPRYPELLDHFERLGRNQLGPDAEIKRDLEGVGGIIAHHGDRRVDYTLPALADRALDQLGDDIEQLWA